MKSEKETLLVLTSAGMEIAWRYAWSSFLAFSILQHPFPLPVALSAFAAAAYITRLSGRRNWRRIQAALLHTAGFAFAALLIAYRLFFRDAQFFNGAWVADLILQPKAPQQWFILLLVLCCLLLFWLGGRSLEKRSRDYFTVCLQFDKGLGLLFLLLLIKFLIELKGGIRLEDPATGLLVIAFILFSLISIGLVLSRAGAKKSFPQGVWNRVLYLLRGFDSAAAVYAGVLCWGRRSGLPPVPSETAGEYGIRLKRQFPKLKEEIEMIIEAFNREVYGKIMIEQRSFAGLAAALNRMRSPRHWPSRMRGWSVQQPLQPDRLIVKQHK